METVNQVVNSSYKFVKGLKKIINLKNYLEKDMGDKKSSLSIINQI